MAGIINQTRYLWGAQERAAPAMYGLSGGLRPLPEPDPSESPSTPALLVDDFLRRRCLRCHIHQKGAHGHGLYRAGGCAACHMVYDDDGLYKGRDKAIDPTAPGYPATHRFTRRIPDMQCLHCHNHNHTGADYHGLFEHDYSSTYRAPSGAGEEAAFIYGLDQHRLARDVHAERGLLCLDCHTDKDVMGDGAAYSFQMEAPKRTCVDCHGGYGTAPANASIPEIANVSTPLPGREPDAGRATVDRAFISRVRGTRHPLPAFSTRPVAHSVQAHARVRCSACHAQWSYQDYGLSVLREDRMDVSEWRHLVSQGDPELEGILKDHLEGRRNGAPVSRDRITGEERPGIWLQGWRFRNWESMPLGVDHEGRVAVLRPHYQFFITYIDRAGNVALDSALPARGDGSGVGWSFMPHVPHTTAPWGRPCDACHRNRAAAGLGTHETLTRDTQLSVPSPPAVAGMRLLSDPERKQLLEPSAEWRRLRLEAMGR